MSEYVANVIAGAGSAPHQPPAGEQIPWFLRRPSLPLSTWSPKPATMWPDAERARYLSAVALRMDCGRLDADDGGDLLGEQLGSRPREPAPVNWRPPKSRGVHPNCIAELSRLINLDKNEPGLRRREPSDLLSDAPRLHVAKSLLRSCAGPVPIRVEHEVRNRAESPDWPRTSEGRKPLSHKGFRLSSGSGGGTRTLNFRINRPAPPTPRPARKPYDTRVSLVLADSLH